MAAPSGDEHTAESSYRPDATNAVEDPNHDSDPDRRHRNPETPKPETRVARIETTPMTPAEYDNAVEALAVLIARSWRSTSDHDAA